METEIKEDPFSDVPFVLINSEKVDSENLKWLLNYPKFKKFTGNEEYAIELLHHFVDGIQKPWKRIKGKNWDLYIAMIDDLDSPEAFYDVESRTIVINRKSLAKELPESSAVAYSRFDSRRKTFDGPVWYFYRTLGIEEGAHALYFHVKPEKEKEELRNPKQTAKGLRKIKSAREFYSIEQEKRALYWKLDDAKKMNIQTQIPLIRSQLKLSRSSHNGDIRKKLIDFISSFKRE